MHRTKFKAYGSPWNNSCQFYWAVGLIQMRMSLWIWRSSYKEKKSFNWHKASTIAGLLPVWGSCLGPLRQLQILCWSLLRLRRRHISHPSALVLCIFITSLEKRMSSLLPGGYWAGSLQEPFIEQRENEKSWNYQNKASMQNSHSNKL